MYATVTCGECGGVVAEVEGKDRSDIEKRAIKGMKCPKARCSSYDLLRLHLHEGVKLVHYETIPSFTRGASYAVDQSWQYLPGTIEDYVTNYGLDVNPDFQRGYVWTPEQKVRYIEFCLRGGATGKDIYMNHPHWNGMIRPNADFVLVDGKQRLDAVLGYLKNDFKVFGHYHREYTDRLDMFKANFRVHINDLKTRKEVLQWYLDLNSGGTVHTKDELDKVKKLISAEPEGPPKGKKR